MQKDSDVSQRHGNHFVQIAPKVDICTKPVAEPVAEPAAEPAAPTASSKSEQIDQKDLHCPEVKGNYIDQIEQKVDGRTKPTVQNGGNTPFCFAYRVMRFAVHNAASSNILPNPRISASCCVVVFWGV